MCVAGIRGGGAWGARYRARQAVRTDEVVPGLNDGVHDERHEAESSSGANRSKWAEDAQSS